MRASVDKSENLSIMQFVYIIQLSDKRHYVGCTSNLEERLKRHLNGLVPSTMHFQPSTLITYIAFTDKYKAFEFEKYLKSGSGRAFAKKE
jgi:putative endonuclease